MAKFDERIDLRVAVPLVAIIGAFGGLSPLCRTYVKLDKLLIMNLLKEERETVSSYQ